MVKKQNFLALLFKSEKAGGLMLLFCVVASLSIANSMYGSGLESFLAKTVGISSINLSYSISSWINDGLMAIFFLLVGLEIKREIAAGELSTRKGALLPIVAALGGMIVPALIYAFFNHGQPSASGWGIPMATDIAFALAIISLLGKKVPLALKVFLAALAIADDLGAILVIALFYTEQIHWLYLLFAAGIYALLWFFNFLKITSFYFYLVPGMLLWYFIHHSGIHATIAGVLLAFSIPMYKNKTESPVQRLEHLLKIPVSFIIMPIFALANTNIKFENNMLEGLFSPIGQGIFFGLAFGKTIGITLFSWSAVKLKWANFPSGTTIKHVIGAGMLAGIGFTMSIFISLLSFNAPDQIALAKFSILLTSIFAGSIGFIFLSSIKQLPPIKEK